MKAKCKKVSNDKECLPELLVNIKGERKKKLTKLESFILSTVIYFKGLKYGNDSQRTVKEIMNTFFGLESIDQVLDIVIDSLIKKKFIHIMFNEDKKSELCSISIGYFSILKSDSVYYDIDTVSETLAVNINTGEYYRIKDTSNSVLCGVKECPFVNKNIKQIMDDFKESWYAKEENYFFEKRSIKHSSVLQSIIQKQNKNKEE